VTPISRPVVNSANYGRSALTAAGDGDPASNLVQLGNYGDTRNYGDTVITVTLPQVILETSLECTP
jgi:hypothetical protein